jgi:hypothetical protein
MFSGLYKITCLANGHYYIGYRTPEGSKICNAYLLAAAKKPKSDTTKQRMAEACPHKVSIRITCPDETVLEFSSLTSAAKHFGIDRRNFANLKLGTRISKGKFKGYIVETKVGGIL